MRKRERSFRIFLEGCHHSLPNAMATCTWVSVGIEIEDGGIIDLHANAGITEPSQVLRLEPVQNPTKENAFFGSCCEFSR